ncbi:MAG: hypothetical protein K6G26_08970 [Lachnospiraceae bacterium]|nr:hypothetical protein [Lachnospiraceae bacterium]
MKKKDFIIIIYICSLVFVLVIFLLSPSNNQLEFSYEIRGNLNKINETIHKYSSEDYRKELEIIKNETNRTFIFPETISDTVECNGFSYLEDVFIIDWGENCRAEVYFSMIYTDDEYVTEIKRISSITNPIKDKKVILSNNLFGLPAYIAIYNHHSRYEYVLINKSENEIIYIYLFECGNDNFCFSNEYIPNKLLKESDFPKDLISSSGDYDMY